MPQLSRERIVLLAIIAAVLLAAVFVYIGVFGAPRWSAEPENFVVTLKAGTAGVSGELKSAGFIRSEWAFALALRLRGVTAVKPGGYELSKAMNVWQVAGVFARPSQTKWVVIPEGLRKEEIADILAKQLGWDGTARQAWLDATTPDADRVEGVYFPDSYLIPGDEQPPAVAARLRARFEEKFALYAPEALRQNEKWTTLLKIASLVQREAAGAGDMPLIAGIIWNRLDVGMKLDIDATVQYARGDTGRGWWAPIAAADKQLDSPYNTYKYAGLPPHPIDNPGLDAIAAALHPAKTDCLYYLHDRTGAIHCAETYEEHQANIAKYLR
jgi:UPF0755 protein